MKTLSELFDTCLSQSYTDSPHGGNYAPSRRGTALILYFQHSVGREDWKNNFDLFPHRSKDGFWAHRGFLRVWEGMKESVLSLIREETLRGIRTLYCVGYSHGSPLALLCMERARCLFPSLEVVGIGFGGPRCLWGRIPSPVKDRVKGFLLVKNPPDLVTHLPPALFGYRHPYGALLLPRQTLRPILAHTPSSYANALKCIDAASPFSPRLPLPRRICNVSFTF